MNHVFAPRGVQVARRMNRNAARVAKQLRQEELQYFRSFLHRMGPEHREELLNTVPNAEILCSPIFGCRGDLLLVALDGFVSKRGPIVYPDYPIGTGRAPPDEFREATFLQFKRMLEDTDIDRFRYTPLDRFIQFLFDHQDVVQAYILNPDAADDLRIDPELLGERFPLLDHVGLFFALCSNMRSGVIPPDFLPNMNRVYNAFLERGFFKTEQAEAHADDSELASSGSEDTEESQGDQNANAVIENA